MTLACSHYRFDGQRHGCAVMGECKPIQAGPDISGCPEFHNHHHRNGRTRTKALALAPAPETTGKRPPCANLGQWTGEMRTCRSCKGKTELKVMACSEYKVCTIGKKIPGMACCEGCGSYRKPPAVEPLRITTVDLPKHYNCSTISWRGQRLLASRLDRDGVPGVYLSELGDDLQPIWTYELVMSIADRQLIAEDPRLFVYQGHLHVSFSSFNGKATDILVARLSEDLQVEHIWQPILKDRQTWEKSWLFFEHDSGLRSVYSVNPHVILAHDGARASKAHQVSHRFRWPVHMRGGAITRVGNEWFHWFHTMKKVSDHYFYSVGVYTFASEPPFAPLRCIPDPVLLPSNADRPIGYNKTVIFPCGVYVDDGRFVLSCGYHDRECRIVEFDAAAVDRALVRI